MQRNSMLLVLYGGLLGVAFYAWQKNQADSQGEQVTEESDSGFIEGVGIELESAAATAADFIDSATGGMLKISAMRTVDLSVLRHPNVIAILRVIREGEGTADVAGYRRIFGGQLFTSFDDHPRITVRRSGYKSTAAGAYQMLASTWDETKRMMGLTDFSPASQDAAAVGRIAARGALPDVLAGRFDVAIRKIAKEWASMPYSPYGQPVISIERARQIYASAGGAMGNLA